MRNSILGSAFAVLGLYQGCLHAGDVLAGLNAFNSSGCISCHGASGRAPTVPDAPVIGGKPEAFIAGELTRFRTGERKDRTMTHRAASLSDADIANISAYLAGE
ncbi:MAG TPA: c-type cytochrome [Gammaproteobacteria bacterium]|nr:c-type cytochrome [Gammaproteobacteria bacterium]